MIEIQNIGFSYGKTRVLSDVSLKAKAGECVAILGNNGAGKSTLITCVNRIRQPKKGEVLIDGRPVRRMGRRELAQNVAYVAQKNEMSQTTVFDCVLLGRRPYMKWGASGEDIEKCLAMLRRVGMEEFQLRSLDEMSGGELQKVMLARALVQEPKVLLLDEPTSSLDPKNQYEMMALVRELAHERQITVLVVIHDLNLAIRYCDRFFFLKNGKGYCYGDSQAVTDDVIRDVYGICGHIAKIDGKKVVVIG
ncbi:ABC transporter ATP-binding protein [Clostridiaceae bacterium]|nr:ABC transporter ATP-binding protein [Clostridiaceae bacterium]RKI18292.1 ABC transporter ATP-binding protein [bacterium 1XD21-70]